MAIMIPEETCRPNEPDHPENVVFDIIEAQFDDSWTVFHSWRNIGTNREAKLIDAEADFIFVHATHGVLCVEVKGGNIKHERGQWSQNGRPLTQSPAKQASHNRYNIQELVEKRIHTYGNISYGFAVCFPDAFTSGLNLTPDLERITLIGADLKDFQQKIISVMNQWNKQCDSMPQATADAIVQVISPKFEIGTGLADIIGQEEREFFRLTEMQCQMLDFIDNHKRAVIRGCAGSGKTILAVKKAKQLAKQGHSVLFLVYNTMISGRIQKECESYENIKVIHFHGLCLETLKIPKKNSDEFWDTELPGMFFNHIVENPIKYDAVIVDEAQDFRVEFWDSVPELVEENGWFFIFYDPDQNLFETKLEIPDLGKEFLLDRNCRNTKTIFEELKRIASVQMFSGDAPEGSPIERDTAKSANDARNILNKLLYRLMEKEGLTNRNIVILGAHHLEHTSVGTNNILKTYTILEDAPLPNEKCVEYHTLYKFKGCESDVIIILDYDESSKEWEKVATRYTAMSRAKHKLYIIEKGF